jgi:hypothetical protein
LELHAEGETEFNIYLTRVPYMHRKGTESRNRAPKRTDDTVSKQVTPAGETLRRQDACGIFDNIMSGVRESMEDCIEIALSGQIRR